MPPKSQSQEQQDQAHLVRAVEAALDIEMPNETDTRFRASLLSVVTDQLGLFTPAAVIRMHTAACAVKFPADDVMAFRAALQRAIGRRFNLRAARIARPSKPANSNA